MKKAVKPYIVIVIGSVLYALGTVLFLFPNGLLLGGTSGISVILNIFLKQSPGMILVTINSTLMLLAFFTLGKDMAVKSLIGSVLTTLSVGLFEKCIPLQAPLVANCFVSGILGAAMISLSSALLFYVDSSSGGTDIIALIIRKYFRVDIGKALLLTDFLIVLAGGFLSGYAVGLSSLIGLLIKTLGIDYIIRQIKRKRTVKG